MSAHAQGNDATQPNIFQLEVSVLSGKSLAARDSNGKSDPFVELHFRGNKYKTKVRKKTLNPVWTKENTFSLGCFSPSTCDETLRVRVWDYDRGFSRNDFMGEFEIDPSLYVKEDTMTSWYELNPRTSNADGPITGGIQLQINVRKVQVLKEGYLYKKGGNRKNWKRRYFVLRATPQQQDDTSSSSQHKHFDWELCYFEKPEHVRKSMLASSSSGQSKCLGKVLLFGASIEMPKSSAMPIISSGSSSSITRLRSSSANKKNYFFTVHPDLSKSSPLNSTNDENSLVKLRSLELRTPSQSNFIGWIDALFMLCPEHKKEGVSATGTKKKQPVRLFGESLVSIMDKQRKRCGDQPSIPISIHQVIERLKACVDRMGLFRIAGSKEAIGELRKCVEKGVQIDWSNYEDHTCTGFLKQFLRELEEPLLTYALYDEWIDAIEKHQEEKHLDVIGSLLTKLPKDHFEMLSALMELCHLVANQNDNKMDATNVSIVMSPNLMWDSTRDIQKAFAHLNITTKLIELMISHYPRLFGQGGASSSGSLPPPPLPVRRPQSTNKTEQEQMKEVTELFNQYDFDKSQTLDKEEFFFFFSDVVQSSSSPIALQTLKSTGVHEAMKIIDTDGDNEVSLGEFLTWWKKIHAVLPPPLV
mmetsp:Transcript_1589/g.2223  ORF Transcript_1589/g.2223 Transcript_1589/m.2223 type:complete len:643 (-) Transcript_1589:70-1998(-)